MKVAMSGKNKQMMHEKMEGQPMQSQIDMAEKHLKMMEVMMSKMTGAQSPMPDIHSH
ncbi:hypothetical protein [Alteromonas sp. CYL-A6]|uniref:hypothetical protein n=1 Tax=Alteromonas nitratireducens TaxID=3390813 RepID=UPI0034AA91C5